MSKSDKTQLDDLYKRKPKENEIAFNRDKYLDTIILDMSFQHSDFIKEIETSVKAEKNIDQKFLYLDPISVKNWKRLIDSDEYNIYNDCLSALRRTLKSDTWKDYVNSGKINCIVDLGVGAGEKDNLIIKSFIKEASNAKDVQYVLIDTSIPMLEITISQLKPFLKRNRERINFYAVRTDFMKLGLSKDLVRQQKGNVVFFSLGCTFCNIDERQFMKSLGNIILKGDLFVVGVELYNPDEKELSTNSQKESYDNEMLKKLAMIPLKMISDEIDDKIKLSDIDIIKSQEQKYSQINNTENIIIKYKNKEIDLATTSRYNEADFTKFVSSFGYKLKEVAVSGENIFYKHFIFEFTGN